LEFIGTNKNNVITLKRKQKAPIGLAILKHQKKHTPSVRTFKNNSGKILLSVRSVLKAKMVAGEIILEKLQN
jgi:hypothetical protein